MKASIFSFLTISTILSMNAQITISQADMPSPSSVFIYNTTSDLMSEDFSLTGANYAWDYSAATSSGNDTLSIVTVSSTPFAYQLYFNNQFQYPDHKSDYATAGQDLNVAGQVTITDRFNYFKVNSTSLEITGFGANVNGIPASVKYDTIDQQYPFLMSYNMPIHNSVGYYLLTIPTFGTYGQWIRRDVESDGWGSLVTPDFTYPSVLRVKTTLEQRDTVYVDQFGFGQTIDRPTEVLYEWFTNTDNVPVMSATVNAGQVSNVKYLMDISVSVNENNADVKILPTVNDGVFRVVSSVSKVSNIQVYDMNGKMVITVAGSTNEIDLSSFEKGIYLIKLGLDNDQIISQKVVR